MAKILLVEDDLNTGFGLTEILQDEGHQVIFAQDAHQALQKVDADVDILLTDLRLPDLNGLQLFNQIRQQHPHIITIVMTAFSNPDLQIEAEKKGVFRWITKPLDLDKLLTDIREAMAMESKLNIQEPQNLTS
ncbi:MAG: response regulator [Calditrichaeota bacterium]|nr:MAG: response regulator [Calditrichota bacterium]